MVTVVMVFPPLDDDELLELLLELLELENLLYLLADLWPDLLSIATATGLSSQLEISMGLRMTLLSFNLTMSESGAALAKTIEASRLLESSPCTNFMMQIVVSCSYSKLSQ